MMKETDLAGFVEALENADLEAVQSYLQQDPMLAVAVLPDGWPAFLLQPDPVPAIIDLLLAQYFDASSD